MVKLLKINYIVIVKLFLSFLPSQECYGQKKEYDNIDLKVHFIDTAVVYGEHYMFRKKTDTDIDHNYIEIIVIDSLNKSCKRNFDCYFDNRGYIFIHPIFFRRLLLASSDKERFKNINYKEQEISDIYKNGVTLKDSKWYINTSKVSFRGLVVLVDINLYRKVFSNASFFKFPKFGYLKIITPDVYYNN